MALRITFSCFMVVLLSMNHIFAVATEIGSSRDLLQNKLKKKIEAELLAKKVMHTVAGRRTLLNKAKCEKKGKGGALYGAATAITTPTTVNAAETTVTKPDELGAIANTLTNPAALSAAEQVLGGAAQGAGLLSALTG